MTMNDTNHAATERKKVNQRDLAADRTKSEILAVATEEFATNGFTGARVDAIAERIRTSKAMIYYYFGSKDGLYIAVMENVYSSIREAEENIQLDHDGPARQTLRTYIESTFEYHERFPMFSRIISIENINNAAFLKMSQSIKAKNRPVLQTLERILERGIAEGSFRPDITPLDLHYLISALCIYRVSNRQTFGTIFDVDFADEAVRDRQRELAVQGVLLLLAPQNELLPVAPAA